MKVECLLLIALSLLSGCNLSRSVYDDYDFDIVRRGEAIVSVAGFKFGSKPPFKGQTDIYMRLDPPVRDFTHIHLGFASNKLHTVTFLTDFPRYTVDDRYEPAFARELDILRSVCESGWETNTVGFFAGDNSLVGLVGFQWNTKESGVFIFGPMRENKVGWCPPPPDAMAVCFVDWSVKRSVGDVVGADPWPEQRRKFSSCFLADAGQGIFYIAVSLRRIGGLGIEPIYFHFFKSQDYFEDYYEIHCVNPKPPARY